MGMNIGSLIAPIVGAGMNLAMRDSEDRRQIRQQGKLTEQQVKAQKELGKFQYEQQMNMWRDTNWSAQVEEAKKAGMSVSALLGNGAGGGGTANASTGASANGGQAADAASTQNAMTQTGMAVAQMELIKAQTKKTEAEAVNIEGGERQKLGAEIANLNQGIENQKAQKALTETQTSLNQITEFESGLSRWSRLHALEGAAKTIDANLRIVEAQGDITEATKKAKISEAKAQAYGAWIENNLKSSNIEVNKAEIAKWSKELAQKDTELGIKQFAETIKANYPSLSDATGRILDDGIETLFNIFGTRPTHKQKQ